MDQIVNLAMFTMDRTVTQSVERWDEQTHDCFDRYLPAAEPTAANPPHSMQRSIDRRDRRTAGQTPDRYTDPVARHASSNNNIFA